MHYNMCRIKGNIMPIESVSVNNAKRPVPAASAKQEKANKIGTKQVLPMTMISLSAISLGTLAGIFYFARRGSFRLKPSEFVSNKTYGEIPEYYSSKVEFAIAEPNSATTMDIKPKWNALTTVYKDELSTESKKAAAPNNKKGPKKNEVIPGIIKQVSIDIKDYIKKCGIDKNNNKVNPEVLDEILTKAVGGEHIIERPYTENGIKGRGRVKEYTSPNGRVYVLETHDSPKGIITRLYMHDKDKHLRAYLHADGTFRLNSYTSAEAHFDTTAKGKRWMEKSKFAASFPTDAPKS